VFGPLLVVPKIACDLVTVIEVVGKRRMDIGEREARKHADNVGRAVAAHLVPKNDVHYTNTVPGNARPATTDSRRLGNVLPIDVDHCDTS
jgi:hypothetical protein